MKTQLGLVEEKTIRVIAAPMPNCTKSICVHPNSQERESEQIASTSFRPIGKQPELIEVNELDQSEDGFTLTVTIHDAVTVNVSSSITSVLGYPKETLIGKCILNYLYPGDRVTFASHLNQGLQTRLPTGQSEADGSFVFYVRILAHSDFKADILAEQGCPSYRAFQLKCHTMNVRVDNELSEKETEDDNGGQRSLCLIVVATPVVSAHKDPGEAVEDTAPFCTRHTANCNFSHMDTSGIPLLGYLPQDIIGYSVFDFYHKDDLSLIRDIYRSVTGLQGNSFKSKPYRFRVFNGGFVTMETEWSCFINPWSRKLEFVIGQHRIIIGPLNPNIFQEARDGEKIPLSIESSNYRDEIICSLSQEMALVPANMTDRKRRLPPLIFNNMDDDNENVASPKERSCSDLGSIVMGDISPHREDSEPSTETPPSCQESRLQDNIERFFASQPSTNPPYSEGSTTNRNTSQDGSGSNDGSGSSNPQNCSSLADSAFQSGSCGDGNATGSKANATTQAGQVKQSKLRTSKFSLTEKVLSQHDRVSYAQHRPSQVECQPSTSENVTMKRTCNRTPDNCKSTAKKQQRLNHEHNRPSRKTSGNTSFEREPNQMPNGAMNSPFALGFPFMMNQANVCQSCSNNFTVPNGNQVVMPVMFFGALPMPLMPSSSHSFSTCSSYSSVSSSMLNAQPIRKSVRLQTDFGPSESGLRRSKVKGTQNVETVLNKVAQQMEAESNRLKPTKLKASVGGSTESYSFSSSSGLKSDGSSELRSSDSGGDEQAHPGVRGNNKLKQPPWMEGVDFSEDLAYRYQTPRPGLSVHLQRTLDQLTTSRQPDLVRKQLALLNSELEEQPTFSVSADNNKSNIGFDILEEELNEEIERQEESVMSLIGVEEII
ncbi:Period circadian protein [Halotydeus destructor]|nr:Period circadian protein [Halotydeus destructor]